MHPHPAHQLVDVEDGLALAPGVQEGRGRAQVEGAGAEPDQVAADPRQLAHDHPQVLAPRRHLDAEQPLGGEREAEVVDQRRQVIHAIAVGDALLVAVALEVLLEAGVEEADVGPAGAHHLAVEVEHQAQHPVGRGVLGTHVQLHGVLADLGELDGVEVGGDAEPAPSLGERVLAPGEAARRRQDRGHQRDDPGMPGGRSAAGSAHSMLWVKATGSPKET